MQYMVFEAKRCGFKIESTMIYSSEDKKDCARMEVEKRQEYRKVYGPEYFCFIDCFTRSEKELEESRSIEEAWNKLTPEERKEMIEVDGKRYIRAIYEALHKPQ